MLQAAPYPSEGLHPSSADFRPPLRLHALQVEARASGDGDVWCADQTVRRYDTRAASGDPESDSGAVEAVRVWHRSPTWEPNSTPNLCVREEGVGSVITLSGCGRQSDDDLAGRDHRGAER